ncbi:MAG: haloacid dehalogenase family protein [uncultured archaeon A07HN63]|nr:MAG: haloacid dehalogenase family protein [uncultured archaeon A07HN63]
MSDPTQSFVLFDMDGVVLEGHGTDPAVHEQALDDAIDAADLSVDAETRTLLAGYEYDTEFIRGCDRLGVDPVDFYHRREQHSASHAIDRLDAGHRTLYPDADAIHRLDDEYALGLVSNNYDAVTEFVVDRYDLTAFEYVRGRDPGVGGFYRRKPNPHYLLTGRDALDGSGGVYVGDRTTDVVAATRAGLDAVFVRRDHNQDVSLPITPTAEIASLTELPSVL